MAEIEVKVLNCVPGTTTDYEGSKLYHEIAPFLESGYHIRLSLENCVAMSKSFLESSFGALVDEFGIDLIIEKLTFTDDRYSLSGHISKFLVKAVKSYRYT